MPELHDVGSKEVDRTELETVTAMANIMVQKLRENRHKGGWRDSGLDSLFKRLHDEMIELEVAVSRLDAGARLPKIERDVLIEQVGREAADVCNFSMFVADVCGALTK